MYRLDGLQTNPADALKHCNAGAITARHWIATFTCAALELLPGDIKALYRRSQAHEAVRADVSISGITLRSWAASRMPSKT